MCNFIPLRNLLIALGILAGFAASSAMFALMWERFGGFPLVTAISYTAAATWAFAALVVLAFAMSALTTFCTCASAIPACAAACASEGPYLRTLLGFLVALAAVCGVLAGDLLELGWPLRLGVVVAAVGVTGIMVMIGLYASRLGACQGP